MSTRSPRPRPKPKKPIENHLAEWRDALGLTQEIVAGRMGVQPPTISRYENAPAHKLTAGVIAAYAEALGQPPLALWVRPGEAHAYHMSADLSEAERARVIDFISGLRAAREGKEF